MERVEQLYQRDNPSDITGVPSGYHDLDQRTSGFQGGDLVIVAGRPSMGKTAFALNIAEHVAVENRLPVAVFSMEMAGTQLAMRMLGSIGHLDQHKLRTGRLTDEDWNRLTNAVGKLHDAPIHIDETPALNALELRARSRRLHRQYGKLGLIVVDYLQLMSAAGGGEDENRATQISAISRSLKALAKELDVPVVALSQLNRGLEQRPNKRPVMSDLRESGAIEQDADLILFIYRDEVYNDSSPDKGIAEIIIGKQRNGPIGTVKLTFLGEYTRFENHTQSSSY
jgi:replicative DNA helicase